jgi:hypothetical protein
MGKAGLFAAIWKKGLAEYDESKKLAAAFRATGLTSLGKGFDLRAFLTGGVSNRSWFYDE